MPKIIENIRESLVENAEKVLLEEGISAVTVRRISAESGIASGTVYHYFSSKEDILAAVFLKRWIERKDL
ncbi:MAG: helix-turn-helix domain-containing protein [Lachnospiraceae bacterium]|nr:helix-turn-helix domain-containing protein [Lachnospiraceae bacterium]